MRQVRWSNYHVARTCINWYTGYGHFVQYTGWKSRGPGYDYDHEGD